MFDSDDTQEHLDYCPNENENYSLAKIIADIQSIERGKRHIKKKANIKTEENNNKYWLWWTSSYVPIGSTL